MTSLFAKIVMIPIILMIGMYSTEQIEYSALWHPFLVVLALIFIEVGMESMILSKETFWSSLFMDFITSLLIIWGLSNLLPGTHVTFIGAFTLSLVLGVMEFFIHRYLIGSHKDAKSTA